MTAVTALAFHAHAQESAETGGSFSLSTSEGASGESSGTGGNWFTKYAPEAHLLEFGIFGGVIFPASDHNLRQVTLPRQKFKSAAPELGLRAAYFPLSFAGVEGEAAVMPTKTEDDGGATMWVVRGHVLAQVPGIRITPFALLGIGRLGATTDSMGDDGDPTVHYGGGVKAALTKHLSVRVDVRNNVTSAVPETRESRSDDAHHPELLFGLSYVLGRSDEKAAPPPPPSDRDGDGFLDPDDECPDEKGVAPDGCPIGDRDKDGFLDPDDKCPDEKGVAPDGCPIGDRDKDGFLDPEDKCPDEKGVAPDGCPVKDTDGDGILDPEDKCPKKPETKNGFEDKDGCPDELPAAVKKFTGVIKGIQFAVNKAVIRPTSFKTLNAAAKVLTEYKDLRVRITGHTDSDGTNKHNLELSQKRAEAVKTYLVAQGVDAGRLETRGAGEEEPIADNKTRAGKAKNRRTEFEIIP